MRMNDEMMFVKELCDHPRNVLLFAKDLRVRVTWGQPLFGTGTDDDFVHIAVGTGIRKEHIFKLLVNTKKIVRKD